MSSFSRFLLFFSFCFLGFFSSQAKAAFQWEEYEMNGRTYVPLDNIRAFYGLSVPPRQEGSSLIIGNKTSQIKVQARSQEMYMNNLKFILSHPIELEKDRLFISKIDVTKIIEPILRPRYIRDAGNFNTIILDPGHGGHDAGAMRQLVREADLNLRLAKKLRPLLEKQGFKVYLTRETDNFLTLQERVRFANNYKNAIFISLHFNSGGAGASGIETFTLTPTGTPSSYSSSAGSGVRLRGNEQDCANIALATAIQGTTQRKLGAFDRGIKRARFSVLCQITHPAILFEGGFVSHPKESQLISNDRYLDNMSKYLTEAIIRYKRVVANKKSR